MPTPSESAPKVRRLAVILKGYPRLSETFIAQEILGLERAGFAIDLWSLRHPTDKYLHPMHRAITARTHYLPEYLHDAPWRVLKGISRAIRQPGFWAMLRVFLADLRRDLSANRLRRFGQACVLAAEVDPAIRHFHVHFLHTPGSVARYAALLTGRDFSFSAHAKDIWTIPDWEKREKISACRWGVTCTRDGWQELRRAAGPDAGEKLHLVYHGLDLARFPDPAPRTALAEGEPVRLLTVGRAVQKKGFDDLLTALSMLPQGLPWRLTMVGSGPLLPDLKRQAERAGLSARISWTGALPQDQVIAHLQGADLFVLPSKPGEDGDRDGLPNVLMEAASQGLPLISTRFAAVPEFIRDQEEGLLVPPGDPTALAAALERLIADADLRMALGMKARIRVANDFSFQGGLDRLAGLLANSIDGLNAPSRAAAPREREP
jgi:glycosyltransferase involved in cell wall biosynthesis